MKGTHEEIYDRYKQQGNSKYQKGNYKGAIEDYSQAIKIKPDQATAYNNRGISKGNMQDYKGAIQDFSQAIKLKPDYATAFYNRGNSKDNMQYYKGAIQDYGQAIKLKPDDADAYYDRGISKDNMQDYKGAIQDYGQAIKLKPDDADAYYDRGISKDNMQDYKGAIQDYGQAIKLKPDDADAYYDRGISKDNMQDYKGAIQDYGQAIKLKPDDADAYYDRGISKDNMQDYKGAIQDYGQAIKLKPDYANAYNNRGSSKQNMQDYKGAQSDYLQALRLSPQPDPLHLFNLANLYLKMSLKEKALKRYNEGVKIFQRYNEDNLKRKFELSDGNIRHIKSSIENFENISREVEQIRQQAQKNGRTDILQQLMKINASIASACIQSTDEKADQNILSNEVKALREQMKALREQAKTEREQNKQIKKRLGVVEEQVTELKSKVKQMEKRIYTEERINNMIEKIDSRKLSEFYKILYNMLINHFMAYRMLSTGFFSESVREMTTFDNLVGNVCKAQSIIERIPILGDLVGIPFKILNAFREEKSSRLNTVIANKINSSRLHSEAVITLFMSHLIEELINNKPFNANLEKAIKNEQNGLLEQLMDVFGEFKEKIYSKVFGGLEGKFSYAQQVVSLYLARFTLQLYEVDSKEFSQHCKNENTFTTFFMKCFEDQATWQPIIKEPKEKTTCTKAFLFLFLIVLIIGVMSIVLQTGGDLQKIGKLLTRYFPRLSEASSTSSEL